MHIQNFVLLTVEECPRRNPGCSSHVMVKLRTNYHNGIRIQNFVSVLLTVEESPRRKTTLGVESGHAYHKKYIVIGTEPTCKISTSYDNI